MGAALCGLKIQHGLQSIRFWAEFGTVKVVFDTRLSLGFPANRFRFHFSRTAFARLFLEILDALPGRETVFDDGVQIQLWKRSYMFI